MVVLEFDIEFPPSFYFVQKLSKNEFRIRLYAVLSIRRLRILQLRHKKIPIRRVGENPKIIIVSPCQLVSDSANKMFFLLKWILIDIGMLSFIFLCEKNWSFSEMIGFEIRWAEYKFLSKLEKIIIFFRCSFMTKEFMVGIFLLI